MARMRTVKPSLRTSDLVASWPFEARYFFVLLWGYLDDEGRGLDIPKQIAGDCFPHDEKVTASKVDGWLDLMGRNLDGGQGPICRYVVKGRRYLHAVNWPEHQKPNRPTSSKHPQCPKHGGPVETLTEPPLSDSAFEGLRGRELEGLRGGEGEPPPPRCSKHADNATTSPCGGCKDARLLREEWDRNQAATYSVRQDEIRACRLCDGDGYRYEDGRRIPITPYVKCDHRPLRSVS